ncbi:hypothetical protein PMIN06_013119, partial [Paraphaeosphaeria minitans]
MQEADTTHESARRNIECVHSRSFFISKLTDALRRPINPTKAPSGLGQSLEFTCDTEAPSPSKIFLHANFTVWLAFFLAGDDVKGLEYLPAEDLEFIADEVVNASRHATIDQFAKHFFENAQSGAKYKAKLDSFKRKYVTASEPPATH